MREDDEPEGVVGHAQGAKKPVLSDANVPVFDFAVKLNIHSLHLSDFCKITKMAGSDFAEDQLAAAEGNI